ncbi:MAG: hypothetical protein AABW84_00170 [Nanoarchaeota archaeon]
MTTMRKSNHSNKEAVYTREATEFKDEYCNEMFNKLTKYYNAYKASNETFRLNYGKQFLEDFAELDFKRSANILGLDKDNINVTDLTDLRDVFAGFLGIINKAEVKE